MPISNHLGYRLYKPWFILFLFFIYSSECYKNVPNDWVEAPPMYLERSSFSMNTIGGKILVAGGLGTTG